MLIKKENCFFTGIINAVILCVPVWVMLALVYVILSHL